VQEAAATLGVPVPGRYRDILNAARQGDWLTLSNLYSQTSGRSEWWRRSGVNPDTAARLWQPVLDVYWAFYYVKQWGASNSQLYADQMLEDVPPRSIVFAGSDPGRFVLSLALQSATHDVFVVSQNTLADSLYVDYLRIGYHGNLWLPAGPELMQAASQMRARSEATGPNERTANAALTQDELWQISFALAEVIFERNRARFSFFVDEGRTAPWMLPFLKPHGFLMRLSASRTMGVSSNDAAQDLSFWDTWVARATSPSVAAIPTFRTALARMRSASAGIYIYHEQYSLAETALRQALRIDPDSMDATFRLGTVLLRTQRFDDARALMTAYQSCFPDVQAIKRFLEGIDTARRLCGRVSAIEEGASHGEIDLGRALELTDLYRALGRTADFESMVRLIMSKGAVPPPVFHTLAGICQAANRVDLLLEEAKAFVAKNPQDKDALLNLAAAQVAAANRDEAFVTLKRVAQIPGVDIADLLKDDKRFDMLRQDEEFKQITESSSPPLLRR